MKVLFASAALALSAAAIISTPVAAHPDNGVKAAGKCDKITSAQWNRIRNGISLRAAEQITGCHATFQQSMDQKSGKVDAYFFKTGSKILAQIMIKNGQLWQKAGYYSGL